MADASTIKINPAKSSDLEFDVMIQGMDDTNLPVVKFVLSSDSAGYDLAFKCSKVDGEQHKWVARLPVLTHLKDNTVKFHVEVIIDGYYFEPAQGEVTLVTDPSVKFQPTATKPTVTTSFTVRQSDDDKKDDDKDKDEEDEQITGQYAPTNSLLKPEEEPTQGSVKTAQVGNNDEHIDISKISDIASSVTPGETTDPLPQPTDDEGDESDFDPRRIAETIVKNTFGAGLQRPATQGALFKRTADGRPVVEGLESPADRAKKKQKEARVKEILGKK